MGDVGFQLLEMARREDRAGWVCVATIVFAHNKALDPRCGEDDGGVGGGWGSRCGARDGSWGKGGRIPVAMGRTGVDNSSLCA